MYSILKSHRLRINRILFLIVVFLFQCAQNSDRNMGVEKRGDDFIDKKYSIYNLEGIWAENEEDNALFEIRHDSLYNFEYFDQGFSYTLNDSVWIIHYEGFETQNIILKLNMDSLIYTTETGDTIRLHKR